MFFPRYLVQAKGMYDMYCTSHGVQIVHTFYARHLKQTLDSTPTKHQPHRLCFINTTTTLPSVK